jgi:hypothetical protein
MFFKKNGVKSRYKLFKTCMSSFQEWLRLYREQKVVQSHINKWKCTVSAVFTFYPTPVCIFHSCHINIHVIFEETNTLFRKKSMCGWNKTYFIVGCISLQTSCNPLLKWDHYPCFIVWLTYRSQQLLVAQKNYYQRKDSLPKWPTCRKNSAMWRVAFI